VRPRRWIGEVSAESQRWARALEQNISASHLTCVAKVLVVDGAEQPVSSAGIWFRVLHG